MTGSVHVQGEELNNGIELKKINKWEESPALKKIISFLKALFLMWWLLITKYRKHEVFFVSVPPMGYLLNLVLPHKFSMVIWDVYPDVFKIAGMKDSHPIYKFWAFLNKNGGAPREFLDCKAEAPSHRGMGAVHFHLLSSRDPRRW